MKKIVLRSLTLAAVVAGFASNSAFAQDAAMPAPAAAPAADEAGKFTPSMDVSMRYVLLDSTRKTDFDFLSQDLRLGGKYTQGAFTVAGRARFRGNNYGEYAGGSQSTGGQSVGVDKAYVAYDVYKNDANGTVNFTLGRFAPNGANAYGDDAVASWYGMSGFFPEDGVMLQYSGKPGGASVTAQFAVVNSMQLYLYKDAGVTGQGAKVWGFSTGGSSSALKGGSNFNGNGGGDFGSSSNGSSNTSDKAYIASVAANIEAGPGAVEIALAYGMKNNDVNSPGTAAATNPVTTQSPATANDVQYTEDSIGFNYKDQLKAGVWYSIAMVGSNKTMNDTNGGSTQFTEDKTAPSDNYSVAGLGIQGDSSLFGMTNVLAKDGLLTYAAGASMYMHRQSGGSGTTAAMSDSDAAKNDVTLLSIGGGYTKGKFSTELNYSHFISENDVFMNQGNNNFTTTADFVYLVTSFSL